MLQDYKGILTSSIGRLFDAVACVLLGIGKQSFEGEAAMLLEAEGRKWCRQHGYQFEKSYAEEMERNTSINTRALVEGVSADLVKGISVSEISAKFHYSLACTIRQVAENQVITQIAFSGGVFQNSLLVDMVHTVCANDFTLHFHEHLSPNDENISFGQLAFVEATTSTGFEGEKSNSFDRI